MRNFWKLPENRWELFKRYYKWRVLTHDLDHIHYMKSMTKNYDRERLMWYSLCFGMTYRTPQAFVYTEIFPYLQNHSLEELEDWHKKNWKRTTYGTDARYNKGHFVNQCRSIKEWLNGKSFEEKIDSIIVFDNERENFKALFKEIKSLYKYGRMTGWLTLQALHDLCDLPIDPNQIMLEGFNPNNDSSLGSIWNGMCALRNEPHKMVGKYGDHKCEEKEIEEANELLINYTSEAEKEAGFIIDSFRRETIWCQYKRLFNEGSSKEYPGHSSGDATSRYLYYRENWKEVDWTGFRQALLSQPGIIKGMTYNSKFNKVFGETGILLNMSEMYPDMLDGYKELNIDPLKYKVKELYSDEGVELNVLESVPYSEQLEKTPKWFKKYDK